MCIRTDTAEVRYSFNYMEMWRSVRSPKQFLRKRMFFALLSSPSTVHSGGGAIVLAGLACRTHETVVE